MRGKLTTNTRVQFKFVLTYANYLNMPLLRCRLLFLLHFSSSSSTGLLVLYRIPLLVLLLHHRLLFFFFVVIFCIIFCVIFFLSLIYILLFLQPISNLARCGLAGSVACQKHTKLGCAITSN